MREPARRLRIAALVRSSLRRGVLTVAAVLVVATAAGCGMTQSSFARTAGEVGSEFAAARETLRLQHDGRLSAAYATSAFTSYEAQLTGKDHGLAGLDGAPERGTVDRLVRLYRSAMEAVGAPCLDDSCDWRGQAHALADASAAFLEAAGG
ncbi:MAG: hypothetical protein M3295_06115 [Chloroflexota bacterium]|nr:hypothetical protein [Chloroflexota bacterium]